MKLPFAYLNWAQLTAVRADFVKHELRVVVAVRLDDKTLAMRDVLAALVTDKQPLLVSLEPVETSLNDLPLFAAAADVSDVAAAVAGLKKAGAKLTTEEGDSQ